MRIATNIKALQEVEALEERLQVVKWTIRVSPGSHVVSRTAGLLGRGFPRGVAYERRLRHAWTKRLRRLES